MKNYKSLEAHNYFCLWLGSYTIHLKTERGFYLLKTDVKPSQKINEEPHHPWVIVKKEGSVIAAPCDCMAGLGESCSHVGAFYLKLKQQFVWDTRQHCVQKNHVNGISALQRKWNQHPYMKYNFTLIKPNKN